MGLLYLGTPLPWDEAKHYADHVRHHGITQFLQTWNRLKDRHGDELLWGDEVSIFSVLLDTVVTVAQIEYMVVVLDEATKAARLSLRQTEILDKLSRIVDNITAGCPSS